MPTPTYIRRLRATIGHDLLLAPSVAVLPLDDSNHLLLVRQTDHQTWATIGGSIELDEHPEQAATRHARDEAGVEVELSSLVSVLGGPNHRKTYPNGDQTAYVSTVYRARVTGGDPHPNGNDTTEVGWFAPADLASMTDLSDFARLTLSELGLLGASSSRPRAGSRPQVSTEGPQRQLDQRTPARLWGELLARVLALPGVTEGHSQVSPADSRAFFLAARSEEHSPERNLAPGQRLEPAHLHGVRDTSLHLVLPPTRVAELTELGWGEPHAYGDYGTEFFLYGPRNLGEVEVALGLIRESFAYATSSDSTDA